MRPVDGLRLAMVGLFVAGTALELVDRAWLQSASGLAAVAMGLAVFMALRTGRTRHRLSSLEIALVLVPFAAGLALVPLGLRTGGGIALVGCGLLFVGALGVIVAVLIRSWRQTLGPHAQESSPPES